MSVVTVKTLKEIILDEQRLVTYVSLSKELCMHVNEVKVLLKEFIEDIKNTRPDISLNVNFIVAGLSKGNGARIIVCSEADLMKTVNSFISVFFQHVYSVCQGRSSSIDNAILASTNNFEDFPLCIGLIKGTICAKRSSNEIETLITNSQDAIEEPKARTLLQKNSKNKTKTESKKEMDVVNIQESKSDPTITIKSGNIHKKELQINKKNSAVSNGIAGFFNRAINTSSTKTSKTDTKEDNVEVTDKKTEIKIEPMDVDDNNTDSKNNNGLQLIKIKSEEKEEKDLKISCNKIKKEVKNNAKHKKEEQSTDIKKNAKVDKKRKRVLHVSDSESDVDKNDPFADEGPLKQDSDDEIPPTPSASTVKLSSSIVNPKKKRKIVDKTYTDEDGYILTRKEEVYESCSDNEDEKSTKENLMKKNLVKNQISPTQNKIKNSMKKISPPQKGKQSSIMNFFQKK